MKFIRKNKFFNYYLPLILTGILLLTAVFFYYTSQKSKTADAAWYNTSWTYRKPITIDHNKFSVTATSTFSSFPLEISVTDPQLKTITNGGLVGSSTAADILFTDTDGLTKLDHEIESYSSSTGATIAWVRIPTLTSSADYTIYMYFGNSTAGLADQSNKTGVWDSNYRTIYHLPNGTTLTANDSTSNALNATSNTAAATTGQIDGAASFSGSTDIVLPTTSTAYNFANNISITVSAWIKTSTDGKFIYSAQAGTPLIYFEVGNTTAGGTANKAVAYFRTDANNLVVASGVTTVTDNNWHCVVTVRDTGAQKVYIYVDGNLDSTTTYTDTTAITNSPGTNVIGGSGSFFFNGSIDELRTSGTNRSADWIKTEYNNQSSPSTFYAYGSLGTNTNGVTSNSIASTVGPAWYNTSWTYRKPIVIDRNKISTTATATFSSFPLLVSVTDPQLKSTSNGGLQASSTGADILFTDSNGTTKLDHEIEKYASTTGETIAWVRIPTLTSSSDYTIYIYFGNSGAADQSNKTGVWDSNYKGVWHLKDGTTLSLTDSTSGVNNGTNHSATAATGQIDGGANFGGSANVSAAWPFTSDWTSSIQSGVATFCTWLKTPSVGGLSAEQGYIGVGGAGSGGLNLVLLGTNHFAFWYSGGTLLSGSVTATNNTSYYVCGVAASLSNLKIYVNGTQDASGSSGLGSFTLSPVNNSLYIGSEGGNANFVQQATLDEARVSSIARSADWIKTEYNNQSSPSTFYAYGSLQTNTKGLVSDPSRGNGIAWYNTSWTYRKLITIDHNKLSTTATSTFSNFPVEISITDPQLKYTGNGGFVASSTGADILFTDSNGTTKLDHELERYASTTGETIAWVRIPTLTSSADYTIYIYFGNANAADQSNKTGVWDSKYFVVQHLPNGTTLTANDSTSNAYNGTLTNSPGAVTGQIDGAASFNGSNSYVNNTGSSFPANSDVTVSFWNKVNTADVLASSAFTIGNAEGGFRAQAHVPYSDKILYWDYGTCCGAGRITTDYTNYLDKWAYVTLVAKGDKTLTAIYLNGTLITSNGTSDVPTGARTGYNIGAWAGSGGYAKASMDEFRISTSARSSDWIKTEYNNQNSPTTFYAYGALQAQTRQSVKSPAGGISYVQGVMGSFGSYPSTLVMPGNTVSGNKIVVFVDHSFDGCPISVTDSQSNTYTQAGIMDPGSKGGNNVFYIFTAPIGSSAADTLTFNASGGCGNGFGFAGEYSGLQSSPLDKMNSKNNTGPNSTCPADAGGVTTNSDGELVVGMFDNGGASPTLTAGSESTQRLNGGGTVVEDQIKAAAGFVNSTVTSTRCDFNIYGFIGTFKPNYSTSNTSLPTYKVRGGVRLH